MRLLGFRTPRDRKRALAGVVRLALVAALTTASSAPGLARAGDMDLDDDEPTPPKPAAEPAPKVPVFVPAIATIRPRAYTLSECLALADRNHPNLWAAKARLAAVHAQLDEAKWTPYSFWSASATGGVLPPLGGTPFYNATPFTVLNTGPGDGWQPFLQFNVRGTIPLFTFGKIDNIARSAAAQVRFNEWDLEKARQQVRMDVRRAYFGLMLARDAKYIGTDVLSRLDRGLEGLTKKLRANDATVEEIDKLRLQVYRDEIVARLAEAKKGETFATAALRFLTGIQVAFDIPDEPLSRPSRPMGPVVRYLTAARIFRPDVNLARAGVAGRKAFLDYRRSELFPNIGLGLGATYAVAPSAVQQTTAWIGDGFNRFGVFAGLGIEWGLDILPKQARIAFAESQLEEARALERLALGGVGVEVENAHAVAVEASTREEIWERAEHRAKRWISMVQDAMDLGTKDERALIEPLRTYVFARANHVQALMDYNIALSELARVTGWDAAAPN